MDYHSPQWFLRTEAILCAIIVVTVLACLGFCLMISVKLFQNTELELNGKYKSIQFASEKQALPDDLTLPGVETKAEVSQETVPIAHLPREDQVPAIQNNPPSSVKAKAPEIEVIDLMKEELKKPVVDEKTPETGMVKTESQMLPNADIEAEKAKKLPAIKMKKTKNQNPLTVAAAKPVKMSKVKVRTPTSRNVSPQSLDYPDDPKFRGTNEKFLDYPESSL